MNPSTLKKGNTYEMEFTLLNNGSDTSIQSLKAKVYLSTDQNITPADIELESFNFKESPKNGRITP